MAENQYSDPVSRLLAIGDPSKTHGVRDWQGGPNWLEYGAQFDLKPEHIPELIRMAADEALHQATPDTAVAWASLHAWRALGQLKATEAVLPLLGLFHRVDDEDDDTVGEDLPTVMGMIGPAALQPVAAYLADTKNLLWARAAASVSLEKIGTLHPQSRLECVNALAGVLEDFANNDPTLNGELVTALAELSAVEAASLVEQAYKADRVDESVMGDWEDYQVAVGLLDERITEADEDLDFNPFFPSLDGEAMKPPVKKKAKQEKKNRKLAKESRKKNRKKKK